MWVTQERLRFSPCTRNATARRPTSQSRRAAMETGYPLVKPFRVGDQRQSLPDAASVLLLQVVSN